MLKRIVSFACALCTAILCGVFSLSGSAASPDYDIVNQSFDDLINNYNLSSSDISGSQVCYFSGYSYDKTVYCSTLWIDNKVYRLKIENGEKGFYSNTYESKYPLLTGQYVGYLSCAAFYYSLSETQAPPRYQLTYAIVNDADVAVSLSTNVTNYGGTDVFITNYSGSGSLGDMALDSSLQNSPEPETEPTEPNTGGFQLPDSWINGGNTLETAESNTFDGIDPSDAYGVMESNINDLEFEEDFEGSVSFFWNVVIKFIDSLGIWSYVYAVMFIILIAWLLGRNV